ncbi:MAG TPA: PQQ-dependent sugar dehydrogenase [Chitinophagaceae bacterium]|nr:PQQ-dependent sugar dehydrogenase [Chitinophagaceae bacterium]
MLKYTSSFLVLAVFCLFSCKNTSNKKNGKNVAGTFQFAPDNDSLQLPEGFQIVVVAKDLGAARHMAVRQNGDLYISLNARHDGGSIVALRDTNSDGKADVIKYFGALGRGTGIGIHNGYLYYGSDTAVVRYKLKAGSLLPDTTAELIASLPVQHEHEAKSIAFDNNGNLYVNVGAPSNACQVDDRTKGSPGQQPCPLLEYHAAIWRFKADQPGQTQQNGGLRYVTGIRNCVALAWNPDVHQLYAVMHGRDQLHQLYPQYFDEKQSAELPGEEFLRFKEGADYGWPYVYYDEFTKKLMIGPEYGGDGKKEAPAGKYQDPIMAFPGHWAPNGLLFYTGNQFPAKYRGGAFIAFHGSWNRAPLPQKGYNVVFVPFSGDSPSGKYTVFAGGFTGTKDMKSPGDARYRPTGLAQGNDGSLYVSDDSHGTVFRIVYTGKK